jgi:hypothetical protein
MPCHHNLEEYFTAYLDGGGLRGNLNEPLFRTGQFTRTLCKAVFPSQKC